MSTASTTEDLEAGDLVEVIWDDASFQGNFEDSPNKVLDALPDECYVSTVGYVVKTTSKSIYLAWEAQLTFGNFRSLSRIPWKYVLKITKLGNLKDAWEACHSGTEA